MLQSAGRYACACAVCLVLVFAPGCVMAHFRRNHLHPFTSETTTAQDVAYVGEVVASVAIAVATLGLCAPHEADGTLWNDLEWSFDDADDDDDCAGAAPRKRRSKEPRPSRERRVVGQRRSR